MQKAAEFESAAPLSPSAPKDPATTNLMQAPTNPRLFGEVFGFGFASSLGDPSIGYPSWNFGLLSTVAYFGVHVSWTGDFSTDSGLSTWNNPDGPVPGFIQTAHASGTKVVLTIIMMDSTNGTPNMCSALQNGALTIQRTVAEVTAKGVDGVNVDYESNNSVCTNPSTGATESSQSLFTTFVKNLRAALPSGSYLTVDTYSGAAGYRNGSTYLGFFDIGALANYVDAFLVMAYDMEYANWDSPPLSCPNFCIGPTAPLSTYLFNDGRASSEYRAVVPGSKVIMGIPYYGRKECVGGYSPSNAPPNAVGSTVAVADDYLSASTENAYSPNSDYQTHREMRDAAGATRWDTFTSSIAQCTREMYWDDATALGNKYNLIINDGLRGAGIFALNYGGGAPELWSLINLKFGQCSQAAIRADHTVPQVPGTAITFTGSALCAGTAQYRFWVQPPGGAWTVTQPYGTASTWTWNPTQPLGTYQVEVDARNLGSSVSYDTFATMSFRVALCSTPTLTADHASPQMPGTLVTFTAAGTCQGTPDFRFWKTPPGGTKTMFQDYSSAVTFAWDTSHESYGAYVISVDVRVKGTTVAAEASQTLSFSLTSCIAAALTTDKTSPQPTGIGIGLTGSATCVGAPQYRFLIQPPGGPWSVVQDFASTNAFSWSAGGPGGTYGLELDAKSVAAPPSTMASFQVSFDLTTCSAATLSPNPASPQMPGTAVTLSGGASCPATAQYQFAIKKPNSSLTVVQGYSNANTYAWTTTGLPLGDYRLEVDVRDTGASTPSETSASVTYALANPACTTPAVTTDLASPQGTGSPITFSATTTACPSPLYKFWVQSPDLTWTVVQDYSTATNYRWLTTGPPGKYRIEVDVRDSTRPVAYDQFTVVPYGITGCSAATLAANPPSPRAIGTQILLTGSATCPRSAQFRFWISTPSGGWSIAQDYSSANTYSWYAGLGGNYRFEFDARDVGSAADYEVYTTLPYSLIAPCNAPSLIANPASAAASGATVSFSASTSGCGTPNYRFWVGQNGGWRIVQDYSPASTFNWSATGLAGSYGIEVDVRDQSSAVAYDQVANISYELDGCSSAGLGASPPSPHLGGNVLLSAGAGCPGTPTYRFWVGQNGGWTIVQDYSPTSTFSWNTTGKAPGTYGLEVDVRNQNSTASFPEAHGNLTYVLGTAPCNTPSLSANPASAAASGATVTFSASASGCSTPNYRFWVGQNGGWHIVQDYSPASTFNWSATGLAGNYGIEVDVRDQSSAVAYDQVANINYSLVGCGGAQLGTNKASPQAPGTTILLTGSATCGGSPEYRFWVRDTSGKWTIVQDYSPSSTFSWNTTGLPPGTYGLEVDVRNHGASVAYETVANVYFDLGMTPCTSAHLATDKASPQVHGTTIVLTGSATCGGTPEYRFWTGQNGGWTIVKDFSASNTFSWNTTGLAPGTYGLEVDVRNQGSTTPYETVANLTFSVT
jgi:N-acetylmuramoyl-L-alanine amidase